MMGLAEEIGLTVITDPNLADVIVVNTCGFITAAKEESIDTILELAQLKQKRPCTLIVAGCLAQRYPQELAVELPEVDYFIGTADLPQLAALLSSPVPIELERVSVGAPEGLIEERYQRGIAGGASAYLKISEGCDRKCAFCIIPQIRGRQRSLHLTSLVEEAQSLSNAGVRELNLVAQDTTAYGRDLQPNTNLITLLEALNEVEPLYWIRLLYTYPSEVSPQLIASMGRLHKVVPYLDLPIQHIDDSMLRRMNRGYRGHHVRQLIKDLRARLPGIFLRTTLITGHPGETPEAHQALLDFVKEAEFDHLGVFPFSCEEKTEAATQPDQVEESLAENRAEEIMEVQQTISRRKLNGLRDKTLRVLIEGPSEESPFLHQGRHEGQAPEVDGIVIIKDCQPKRGDLLTVRVTDTADYDLVAAPIEGDES
jgi:ribosomal protein S12 methylthiotransferase